MTGVRIRVELDDDEVRAAFDRLIAAVHDMTPLMRDIGEHLLSTTRERFRSQKAPDGTPWAPLSESTKAKKTRNVGKILTERGFLSGNLAYRAGSDEVLVGSPSVYAGTHQFGAEEGAFGTTGAGRPIPWGTIPARPFLGVSDDDASEIRALVNDYLAEQLT